MEANPVVALDTSTQIAVVIGMLQNEPTMTDRQIYYRLIADGIIDSHENAYNLLMSIISAARAQLASLAAKDAADTAEQQARLTEHAAKLHAAWAHRENLAGHGDDDLSFDRFVHEEEFLAEGEEKNSPPPIGDDQA